MISVSSLWLDSGPASLPQVYLSVDPMPGIEGGADPDRCPQKLSAKSVRASKRPWLGLRSLDETICVCFELLRQPCFF